MSVVINTSRWVSTAPYVRLIVEQSSQSAVSATLKWRLLYIADYAASTSVKKAYTVVINGKTVSSGNYDINGKTGQHQIAEGTVLIGKTTSSQKISFSCSMAFNLTWSGEYGGTKSASGSISVSAITSYKITYNANGGSGAPSAQTKWHNVDILIPSTQPTRTGHTFKGWATTSNASSATYRPTAVYSENATVTLYAVWQAAAYAVKYDANGGTAAPSAQIKTYGKTLTLSTTVPTRTDHKFIGWGTSKTTTAISYNPGSDYTKNADITLYAVWELDYIKPRLGALSVRRCNSDGTLSELGTNALIEFDWATDIANPSISVQWTETNVPKEQQTFNAIVINTSNGVSDVFSGRVSRIIGSNNLNPDVTYNLIIDINDTKSSTRIDSIIPGTKYIIDILSEGKGIAFNKPAELENTMDVNFNAEFRQPVYFHEKVVFDIKPDNKVLWGDGVNGLHMNGVQTITLNEAISAQEHGIILVWSYYTDVDGVKNHSFNTDFVSKYQVATYGQYGHTFFMGINAGFSSIGAKYLTFTDTTITGHEGNTNSGSNSGITFNNATYVLRHVLGI